jgi:nucleotidyltransferase substrate binding protein (TIGR01987 family)
MSNELLDLAPLTLVVAQLGEGWARHQQDTDDTQIRDGLVHRFEVAYDVSQQMLSRCLRLTSTELADVGAMSFRDQIRIGNERGLLRVDWQAWRKYRDMRAMASHAYTEDAALQVVEGIPSFLEEAAYLWQRLNGTTATPL